jgi:Domain of unknown function (DUF4209)
VAFNDLNELVVDPRLSAIVSGDILFELRCLLTDNRGPNLRNQLAHGMLDDSEFSSVEAIYTWWLVLVLCIFSPVVKGTKPEPMPDSPNPNYAA